MYQNSEYKELVKRVEMLESILGISDNQESHEYRWKSSNGEDYYYTECDGELIEATWRDILFEEDLFNNFNIFKSEQDAIFSNERAKVIKELDLLSDGGKWCLSYNEFSDTVFADKVCCGSEHYKSIHTFSDGNVLSYIIDNIGQDKLKKYYFMVNKRN